MGDSGWIEMGEMELRSLSTFVGTRSRQGPSHYKGPPLGEGSGPARDAAGAYRDVEGEDAGAVLRHVKELVLMGRK